MKALISLNMATDDNLPLIVYLPMHCISMGLNSTQNTFSLLDIIMNIQEGSIIC